MADDRLKLPERLLLGAAIVVGRHIAALERGVCFAPQPFVFRRIGRLDKVRRDVERNPVRRGIAKFGDVLEPLLKLRM